MIEVGFVRMNAAPSAGRMRAMVTNDAATLQVDALFRTLPTQREERIALERRLSHEPWG